MTGILKAIPASVKVAAYVYEEEITRFDLAPFINSGLLTVVTIDSEAEENAYVNYAAAIRDDGEAVTGAIGVNRGWAIATDDRRATNVIVQDAPHIQIVSTLEMMKHWADSDDTESEVLCAVLGQIASQANYVPSRFHPLFAWWKHSLRNE